MHIEHIIQGLQRPWYTKCIAVELVRYKPPRDTLAGARMTKLVNDLLFILHIRKR
jgi:hypothetical protein